MTYPELPKTLLGVEEETLARWREEDLFRKTLKATEGGEPFVFYEGPPTANGRPGLHHIISRTIKDLVCRHKAMEGRSVTRIAGWDTHGLPVEIEAEKRLGISGSWKQPNNWQKQNTSALKSKPRRPGNCASGRLSWSAHS